MSRVFGVVLLTAITVQVAAAQQRQVTLTDHSHVPFNGVYVGPYVGASPGLPTLDLYCVDFKNSVRVGDTWTANFTSIGDLLNGSGAANTRYGQQGLGDLAFRYQVAAWLSTQFNAETPSTSSWGSIHQAIWNVFTPNSPNWTNTNTAYWYEQFGIAAGQGALDEMNWDYWYVVTDIDTENGQGGKQEYLTYVTPEPGTVLLMLTGLIGVVGAAVVARRG